MRMRRIAAALVAPLLLAGCQQEPSVPTPGPGASAPASPSSAVAVPTGSAAAVTTTAKDVAGFQLSAHRRQEQYTSPDRTSVASDATPPGFAAPPPGQGRQRYLDQKIRWSACDGFECGTVLVPLDWDRPDGQAITLKMKRRVADGKRTGTLFINPGGPGGSGQQMLEGFDWNSFPQHDVIGWDPRGTGESTPVVCGTPEQTEAYLASDSSPDDAAEFRAAVQQNKDFAAQCRHGSGALLDHISTIDTARDLDYLRHLVGDDTLDYLGISYGTYIGAMYAELYPQRAGRMVLDSAVNITTDDSVIQAMGFDLALRNYATWCAENKCELGSTADEVIASVTGIFDSLDQEPLKVADRELTQSLGVTGAVTYLYMGSTGYTQLTQALVSARKGNGQPLLATADIMNGRQPDGSYDSMTYGFPGVGCIDAEDPGIDGSVKEFEQDKKKAPVLAPYFGVSLTCPLWSATPSPQLRLQAKGAAPILVLGATGDPATPYEQAVSMADQLEPGVLLTWKGAGHSAWDLGNACVKSAVRDFVNDGTVPEDRTVC